MGLRLSRCTPWPRLSRLDPMMYVNGIEEEGVERNCHRATAFDAAYVTATAPR